jgi:hypothetical protein
VLLDTIDHHLELGAEVCTQPTDRRELERPCIPNLSPCVCRSSPIDEDGDRTSGNAIVALCGESLRRGKACTNANRSIIMTINKKCNMIQSLGIEATTSAISSGRNDAAIFKIRYSGQMRTESTKPVTRVYPSDCDTFSRVLILPTKRNKK